MEGGGFGIGELFWPSKNENCSYGLAAAINIAVVAVLIVTAAVVLLDRQLRHSIVRLLLLPLYSNQRERERETGQSSSCSHCSLSLSFWHCYGLIASLSARCWMWSYDDGDLDVGVGANELRSTNSVARARCRIDDKSASFLVQPWNVYGESFHFSFSFGRMGTTQIWDCPELRMVRDVFSHAHFHLHNSPHFLQLPVQRNNYHISL